MSLLVAITSYRVKELTLDCLRSLEGEIVQNPGTKVGICDNGNEDDTAEYLGQAINDNGWNDWAYIVSVMPNRGFAGGTNVILNDALNSNRGYDYYLLLNADTVVRPGAIRKLLQTAENNPEAGIIGPEIEGLDGEQGSYFRFITPASEFIRAARTGPVTKLLRRWDINADCPKLQQTPDWVSFDCALIKKAVIDSIGILDEGYFLYFDDVDYCRSASRAGWSILRQPQARVLHYEGQSNPVLENSRMRRRRPEYWYHSRCWYFRKFHGMSGLLAANLFWYGGRAISMMRELLGNKQPHVCEKEWLDIWKGFTARPKRETRPEGRVLG